jgi:hypothetical protein
VGRALVVGIALVVVLLAGAAVVLLRPAVRVASEVDADVTIVCAASAGTDAPACAAWGDEILAAGPPSTTFELQDVVRLELSRSAFGFGGECEAAWFLGRYPDSAVWTAPVDCPG